MRGRTLNDAFIVLDEAQNTSPEQIEMFLTRLGFNSKMVITVTSPRPTCSMGASGLRVVEACSVIDGIAFVELTRQDVVRHCIVAAIVEAYERFEARRRHLAPEDRRTGSRSEQPRTATDTRRNLRIVHRRHGGGGGAGARGRATGGGAGGAARGGRHRRPGLRRHPVHRAGGHVGHRRGAGPGCGAVEPIYEIDQDATSRVEQQLGTLFAAVRDAPAPVGLTLGHEVAAVEETAVNDQFLVDYTVTVTDPASNRRTYELEQTPLLSPAATTASWIGQRRSAPASSSIVTSRPPPSHGR